MFIFQLAFLAPRSCFAYFAVVRQIENQMLSNCEAEYFIKDGL